MQQEEEIEVNFRLDPHGRTIPTSTDYYNNSAASPANNYNAHQQPPIRRYEPHSVMVEFEFIENNPFGSCDNATTTSISMTALMDEILYDCEISDCGLMPRTFWMPSQDFKPRCSLEQMALDIFQHHVSTDDNKNYDSNTSGAEWWVQIRPSPEKTGRYSMHANTSTTGTEAEEDKDMAKEGVSFHWDKDEDLRILCGGNTYVHPHLSTVTYLTDIGAPTLAMHIRVNNLTGEWIMPNNDNTPDSSDNSENTVQGFFSWPKCGKHLSFDGRYLHAAPSDMMEKGEFQKQCELPPQPTLQEGDSEATQLLLQQRKKLQRRKRRVTFLVNIWLNYKPFGVQPFPETMLSKLSGHAPASPRMTIKFPNDNDVSDQQQNESKPSSLVEIKSTKARDRTSTIEYPVQSFQWPMGDCSSGESIKADIPLSFVRKNASGSSLRFAWLEKTGVQLLREESSRTACTAEEKSSDAHGPSTTETNSSDNEKETKRPRLLNDI